MNRSRVTGDLASHGNIFVDIANDRVGIGTTIPRVKLDSRGDVTIGAAGENAASGIRLTSTYAQIKLPDGQTGANRIGNLSFGDNDDFRIVHDGHHNYITAGVGDIYISHGSANPVNIYNNRVNVNVDLNLIDTDAGSAAGPEFKLFRNSASPADADYLGQIKFAGESDTGVERNYAKITGKILDASNGTEDGIIEFAHIKAGSQVITGRWRSDSLQLLNGTALTVAGTSEFTGDITATGDINANDHINLASGKKLSMASDVFKIYHSTNAAIINESGDLLINQNVSNKDIKISTGSGPAERLRITDTGKVAFNYDVTASDPQYGQVEIFKDGASNVDNDWSYLSFHRVGQIAWQQGIDSNGFVIASTGGAAKNTLDAEKLRIASDGIITQSATHPQIILKDPDGRQVSLRSPSTSNLAALGTDTSHALLFYTNGYSNERLRIANDGQIKHTAASGDTIFTFKRSDTNTTGAVGVLNFAASDDHSVANIQVLGDGDNEGAHIVFKTTSAAASADPYNAATVERLRIKSDGTVIFANKLTNSSSFTSHNANFYGGNVNTGGVRIEVAHDTTTVSGNTASGAFPHHLLLSNYSGNGSADNRMCSIGFDIPTTSLHANATIAYQATAAGTGDLQFWLENGNNVYERLRIKGDGRVFINSTAVVNTDDFLTIKRPSGNHTVTSMTLDGSATSASQANALFFTKAKDYFYNGLMFTSTTGHQGGIAGKMTTNGGSTPQIDVRIGGSSFNQSDTLALTIDDAARIRTRGATNTGHGGMVYIQGYSDPTADETKSNLTVRGEGGNGFACGTYEATGNYASWIQAGYVPNFTGGSPAAIYPLVLQPNGAPVCIGNYNDASTDDGGLLRIQTKDGATKVWHDYGLTLEHIDGSNARHQKWAFINASNQGTTAHSNSKFRQFAVPYQSNSTNQVFTDQIVYAHIVGFNRYSWYKFNVHATSSSRGGSCRIAITWTSRHAGPGAYGEYSFNWYDEHHTSQIQLVARKEHFLHSGGGSYYGWSSTPDVVVYGSSGGGSAGGFYLRLEGHVDANSSTYDGGIMHHFHIIHNDNNCGGNNSYFEFVSNASGGPSQATNVQSFN